MASPNSNGSSPNKKVRFSLTQSDAGIVPKTETTAMGSTVIVPTIEPGEIENAPQIQPNGLCKYIAGGEQSLRILRTAPLHSPIRLKTLHRLAAWALTINVRLRHDLNFMNEVSFHRWTDETLLANDAADTEKFWHAIDLELSSSASASQNHELWTTVPRRLGRLIDDAREVMEFLCAQKDRQKIQQMLDTELIIQQISHGVCDLPELLQRMTKMLADAFVGMDRGTRRASPPVQVEEVVLSRDHWQNTVAVEGLRTLFARFEKQFQACANRLVSNSRKEFLMETIDFEQGHVRAAMADGYHVDNWLTSRHRLRWSSWSPFYSLLDGLVDLVVTGPTNLPAALYLEDERIKMLQKRFHHLILIHTTTSLLYRKTHAFGKYSNAQIKKHMADFSQRLYSLTDDQSLTPQQLVDAVALETAMEMDRLRVSSINMLPDGATIDEIRDEIEAFVDRTSPFYTKHHAEVIQTLKHLVREEASEMFDLDPYRLANQCLARTKAVESTNRPSTARPLGTVAAASFLAPTQSKMAIKIAHMGILHWKVFAELIYMKHPPPGNDDMSSSDEG